MIDFTELRAQFEGLQGKHAGLWPKLPKAALLLTLFVVICLAAYTFYWRGLMEEVEKGTRHEQKLRTDFQAKMRKAVNLVSLRQQKEQVAQYVSVLEKQLPSKAEMDALLSDINQAGVGRDLQFELFKPGAVAVREYYAELPIDIKLVGGYHEFGHFASDVANLPRIVTLNNVEVKWNESNGQLEMRAIAKTYRYLDPEEVAEQQRLKAKARKRGRR
ncbi:MAG: type 4a pilus biogenesis protein PilO [Burkholderiaceae bacterium]